MRELTGPVQRKIFGPGLSELLIWSIMPNKLVWSFTHPRPGIAFIGINADAPAIVGKIPYSSLAKYIRIARARSAESFASKVNPVRPSTISSFNHPDIRCKVRQPEAVSKKKHTALKNFRVGQHQDIGGFEEPFRLLVRHVFNPLNDPIPRRRSPKSSAQCHANNPRKLSACQQ